MICQACQKWEVQQILICFGREVPPYQLCDNCLADLTNCDLSPRQFFNLLNNGHTVDEFYLHGDFYNEETGEAIQPRLKQDD